MRTRLGTLFPLFCFGLATPAMAQITEIPTTRVLNAPYRGGVTAWREADMEMAYGEVWNLTIDHIATEWDFSRCVMPTAKVEMVNGYGNPIPWDRSLIRVYQGYDASGRELLPDGPPVNRELGDPEGGNYLLWHWKLSIKAVGTRSLTESEEFHFRIRFQNCSLTPCSGCCSYHPIYGYCEAYCTYTCDCPSSPACSSWVTLNRYVTIAPTAVAGGVGESHPWYPGNEVLRIRSGAAELAATVGESTRMIGQSFVMHAAIDFYKSREFRLPGAPETVCLQPSTFFRQETSEKATVGTPWPGHMPGWSAELHDGPNDVWDVRAPDGTLYRYSETDADSSTKLLKYIIPPGLDENSPSTVVYVYGSPVNGHKYVEMIRDQPQQQSNYNYIQLNRDGEGRVTSISRNGTETWTIGHDPADDEARITRVTPPGTKGQRHYRYDGDGRLTRIGDHADAEMFTFEYFTSGPNKGQIRFERQRVDDQEQTYAEYQYPTDQIKQILKPDTNAPNDRVITCAYADHRLNSASVDAYTTAYEWDFDNPRGCVALKKTTLPDGTIIANTYHQSGGNRFPFVEKTEVYKNMDNKLTVFDVTYEYRAGNTYYRYPRMQSSRDGLGAQVTYTYTPGITEFNQLTGIIGPTITTGFSPGTPETRYDYYTDPGPHKDLLYERRVKATDSAWIKTRYEYDDLRRLIRTRLDPDGENIVVELAEEPLRPDGQINLMRDSRDFLTRSLYDAAGRLTQIKRYLEPNVEGTAFYDTSYVYDDNGWLDHVDTPIKDQDGTTVGFQGQDVGPRRVRHVRDSLGRLVEMHIGKAGSGNTVEQAGWERMIYHLNRLGETVKVTGLDGAYSRMSYDKRGLVTQRVVGYGAALDPGPAGLDTGTSYDGLTSTFVHDENGRLDRTDHADGHSVDYSGNRDDFGRPQWIDHEPGGGRTILAYDANSRVTLRTVLDTDRATVLSEIETLFDAAGRAYKTVNEGVGPGGVDRIELTSHFLNGQAMRELTKGVNPCVPGSFNSNGESIVPEFGDWYTDYQYDGAARVTATVSPSDDVDCDAGTGGTTTNRFFYDLPGSSMTSTVAYGTGSARSTVQEQDAMGRVTKITPPTGARQELGYNSLAQQIERKQFDTTARQGVVPYPILHETAVYDAVGRRIERRLLDESGAGNAPLISSYQYYQSGQGAGRLHRMVDPAGKVQTYAYDYAARSQTVTDPANNAVTTTFDPNGRLSQVAMTETGPAGTLQRSREISYDDPLGLNLHVRRNGQSGGPSLDLTLNGAGDVVNVDDWRGVVNRGVPDQFGRYTQTTEAVGEFDKVTRLQSGPNGPASYTANPGDVDQTTRFLRTAGGSMREMRFPDDEIPDSNAITAEYNDLGELVEALDQRGRTVGKAIDLDGQRQVTVTSASGDVHVYAYDGLGRLVSAVVQYGGGDEVGVALRYDGHGRLLADAQTINGDTTTTGFAYDEAGRLTGVVYPDGKVLDLTGRGSSLDDLGRPVQVDFDGLPLCDLEFQGGRITGLDVYPSSGDGMPLLHLDQAPNEDGRPEERTWQGREQNVVDSDVDAFRYEYDVDLVKRAVSAQPNGSVDLVIDALGRVSRYLRGPADENGRVSESTAVHRHSRQVMDLLGNVLDLATRVAMSDGGFHNFRAVVQSISKANEILQMQYTRNGQVETESLVWDHAGNLLADGEQFYVYDDLGRLVAVHEQTPDVTPNLNGTFAPALSPATKLASFVYDALGRRVLQEVHQRAADLGRLPDGQTPGRVRYLYGGYRVVEVRDADTGAIRQRNLWSQEGLDVRLRTDDYTVDPGRSGEFVSFYFTTDMMGSPTAAVIQDEVTGDAVVVERYTYDLDGTVFVSDPRGCLLTDVNCDGIVGSNDLVLVRLAFGPAAPGQAEDVCDGVGGGPDGTVDDADLACVRADLGHGPQTFHLRGGDPLPKPDKTFSLHGLVYDHATRLVYARNRYYHPTLGRWTQRDPLLYRDSGNLYEAFAQNAYANLDPMGTEVWVTTSQTRTYRDGRDLWAVEYRINENGVGLGLGAQIFLAWNWAFGSVPNEEIVETFEAGTEYFEYTTDPKLLRHMHVLVENQREIIEMGYIANRDVANLRQGIIVLGTTAVAFPVAHVVAPAAAGLTGTSVTGMAATGAITGGISAGSGTAFGHFIVGDSAEEIVDATIEGTITGVVFGGAFGAASRFDIHLTGPNAGRWVYGSPFASGEAEVIRNRVLANIAETRAGNISSNFEVHVAREHLIRGVADPRILRFSQPTVSPHFSTGQRLEETIAALRTGVLTADELPTIRVFQQGSRLFSLDNRRLLAFKEAGLRQVPIQEVSLDDSAIRGMLLSNPLRFNPIRGEGRIIVIVPKAGRTEAVELLKQFKLIE